MVALAVRLPGPEARAWREALLAPFWAFERRVVLGRLADLVRLPVNRVWELVLRSRIKRALRLGLPAMWSPHVFRLRGDIQPERPGDVPLIACKCPLASWRRTKGPYMRIPCANVYGLLPVQTHQVGA